MLNNGSNKRQNEWSESIAVGIENYIKALKEKMVRRAKGRNALRGQKGFLLKESTVPYNAVFDTEKEDIEPPNTYLGNKDNVYQQVSLVWPRNIE